MDGMLVTNKLTMKYVLRFQILKVTVWPIPETPIMLVIPQTLVNVFIVQEEMFSTKTNTVQKSTSLNVLTISMNTKIYQELTISHTSSSLNTEDKVVLNVLMDIMPKNSIIWY